MNFATTAFTARSMLFDIRVGSDERPPQRAHPPTVHRMAFQPVAIVRKEDRDDAR